MSIRQLYELQLVDSDIDVHEKSLAEVRHQLSDDSELVATKRRISELNERLEDEASARRPFELRIRDIEDRLKTVDARLYGGSITNQRELEAQQEQQHYFREQHTAEEDQLLEMMVASEETQNELEAAASLATEMETRRKQAQPELTGIRGGPEHRAARVGGRAKGGRGTDLPVRSCVVRLAAPEQRRSGRRPGPERNVPGMPPLSAQHRRTAGQDIDGAGPVQQLPADTVRPVNSRCRAARAARSRRRCLP